MAGGKATISQKRPQSCCVKQLPGKHLKVLADGRQLKARWPRCLTGASARLEHFHSAASQCHYSTVVVATLPIIGNLGGLIRAVHQLVGHRWPRNVECRYWAPSTTRHLRSLGFGDLSSLENCHLTGLARVGRAVAGATQHWHFYGPLFIISKLAIELADCLSLGRLNNDTIKCSA